MQNCYILFSVQSYIIISLHVHVCPEQHIHNVIFQGLVDTLLAQVSQVILQVVAAMDQLTNIDNRRRAMDGTAFVIDNVMLPTMNSLQVVIHNPCSDLHSP